MLGSRKTIRILSLESDASEATGDDSEQRESVNAALPLVRSGPAWGPMSRKNFRLERVRTRSVMRSHTGRQSSRQPNSATIYDHKTDSVVNIRIFAQTTTTNVRVHPTTRLCLACRGDHSEPEARADQAGRLIAGGGGRHREAAAYRRQTPRRRAPPFAARTEQTTTCACRPVTLCAKAGYCGFPALSYATGELLHRCALHVSHARPALNSNGTTVFSLDLRSDLGSSFEPRWCNRASMQILRQSAGLNPGRRMPWGYGLGVLISESDMPEILEKTSQSAASSGTIPICENLGVTRPGGTEPGSPWWDASSLTAQPPRSRQIKTIQTLTFSCFASVGSPSTSHHCCTIAATCSQVPDISWLSFVLQPTAGLGNVGTSQHIRSRAAYAQLETGWITFTTSFLDCERFANCRVSVHCILLGRASADVLYVYRVSEDMWTGSSESMRVIKVCMEQRRNERAGETGDPRENQPNNGIVRHDSQITFVGGEQANRSATAVPGWVGGTQTHRNESDLIQGFSISFPIGPLTNTVLDGLHTHSQGDSPTQRLCHTLHAVCCAGEPLKGYSLRFLVTTWSAESAPLALFVFNPGKRSQNRTPDIRVAAIGFTFSHRSFFFFYMANRVQSSAGSPDFRMWDSCQTMPFVGGFSRGSPVSPPFHSGDAPYSPQSPSSALKTSLLRAGRGKREIPEKNPPTSGIDRHDFHLRKSGDPAVN
ncbi:hypothetical protein PR048_028024 [Dryococelus australis]|uniref:Uncharacterized protein n=1 Tax=Dryococelus australis TaxID=614101 RepID=A0ABQ9GI28_9NEOP|nr:hypothetical protein PR048_028024 [Dryococelus australis]